MVTFTRDADEVWRDFATDGVPASGIHKPLKSHIRTWGGEVKTSLDQFNALYENSDFFLGSSFTINPTTEATAATDVARGQVLLDAFAKQSRAVGVVPDIVIADGLHEVAIGYDCFHRGTLRATAAPDTARIWDIAFGATLVPAPDTGAYPVTIKLQVEVFTNASGTMTTGDAVELTTTGTLPTNLALATTYYVRRLSATTFSLAASSADATAGVNLIGARDLGTGVHTLTAAGYSTTFSFSAPIPAHIVANYAVGCNNVKGNNGAHAINGAQIVRTISANRFELTFACRVYGVVPTNPTTFDNATTNSLLANTLYMPKACLRFKDGAGWDGSAREGAFNLLANTSYFFLNIGFSYGGTLAPQDMIFCRHGFISLMDRVVVAGAGTSGRCIRGGYQGDFYLNRSYLGGATTAVQAYIGIAEASLTMIRPMMGSVKEELMAATALTRIFGTGAILVGAQRAVRTTYHDASITLIGSSRIRHCDSGLRTDSGLVQVSTTEDIQLCTDPIAILGPGVIAGNPAISNCTNAAVQPNVSINGGVWRRDNALPGSVSFNTAVAAQGPGFDVATHVTGSAIQVQAGQLRVGARYRCVIDVSKTAAGVAAPVITVRYGTTGTISDTARGTMTLPAQTAAADDGRIVIEVTFTAVATATIQCSAMLTHSLAATGLSTSNAPVARATSGVFTSTAGQFLSVGINAGTSAAWTINQVHATLENIN
jgi:hypothetical protein